MIRLFQKEISAFFSSFTGYFVIIVFLVANSLFMWVFKGDMNVLDAGHANLDTLFIMAPWIFLFLVPAVTMRVFAEEKRSGTLELLLTQPLTELQIILAKYLASVVLIIFSLLPTLIYYFSVHRLGSPPGNLDTGGIIGSYTGLLFLAMVYAAIGIFSSVLSDNQIISFILAVLLSFLIYSGFDLVTATELFGNLDTFLMKLGISEHYRSVSRGVLDTRDLLYFLSVIAFFLLATRMVLSARKRKGRRTQAVQNVLVIGIILLLNYLGSFVFHRFDLTQEKRYSLSGETKEILRDLDDIVYVRVYLDGDLPVGFSRLKNGIRELLDDFRAYSPGNLQYEFIDPAAEPDSRVRNNVFTALFDAGLQPTNAQVRAKDGSVSQKIVFPGAILSYRETEVALNLLKNNPALPGEVNLQQSIQSLEYEFISMIRNLSSETIEKVAFLEGHGELDAYQTGDITKALANFYQIDRGEIKGKFGILDPYSAVIIAKPRTEFREEDKFVLDQYIMQGGKVLWLIDPVQVSLDSLYMGNTYSFYNSLNLEDQLFRYGVRLNPNLVQDIQCHVIPVNKGIIGGREDWQLSPWYYYPILSSPGNHPVNKSLNMILVEFGSQIDTVGNDPGVKKTVILNSSPYSRTVAAPSMVSLRETEFAPRQEDFNKSFLPLGILLEGEFESVFRNRSFPSGISNPPAGIQEKSVFTRMIVVADGDIIRNDVTPSENGPVIGQLGFDRYTQQTFGNKEFILNAVNYLCDERGLMQLRGREFRLRLLDRQKADNEELKWKLTNTMLPVAIVVFFGIVVYFERRRKYRRPLA